MIHLAASNPNPHVLEKVLNSDPNFLVSDVKGIRPVHIAAGCSSPATLQLLLDKSVLEVPPPHPTPTVLSPHCAAVTPIVLLSLPLCCCHHHCAVDIPTVVLSPPLCC